MKKLFYILTAILVFQTTNAQQEFTSIKLTNTPLTVNDTANTEPLIRYKGTGANKGMVRKVSWGYLMSVFAAGITPQGLQSVLTNGDLSTLPATFKGAPIYFQNASVSAYASIQQYDDSFTIGSNKKVVLGTGSTPSIDLYASGGGSGVIPFTHGSFSNYLPNSNGVLTSVVRANGINYSTDINGLVDIGATSQDTKNIPDDFLISCTYSPTALNGNNMQYTTDIIRYIDISQYTGGTVYSTNGVEIVDGNTIFITGQLTNGTGNLFILSLRDCHIIGNILNVGSFEFREVPEIFRRTSDNQPYALHGMVFNRGSMFLATRTEVAATKATQILKVNPYNFNDFTILELPLTTGFLGSTDGILAYEDNLYILPCISTTAGAYLVRISANLTSYEVLFALANPGTSQRIRAEAPFVIYNNKLYVPTINNSTAGQSKVGMSVYDLNKRTLINSVFDIPVNATNVGAVVPPSPHWLTVFNGKLIMHTAAGGTSQSRSLVRFNPETLAVEASTPIPWRVTNDNTITKDGYIYLNPELQSGAYQLKIRYNFTDNEALQNIGDINYWSLGTPRNKTPQQSQITATSQLRNTGADGVSPYVTLSEVATNLSNTPSSTGITVNSSTGTGTTLPLATSTMAGLETPANFNKLANLAVNADGTYATIAAVNSADALKANLAGGNVFTGTQATDDVRPTGPNLGSIGTNSVPYNSFYGYNFLSPSSFKIGAMGVGGLAFVTNNINRFSLTSDGGILYSNTTGAVALGNSTFRWGNYFGSAGNFSGTIIAAPATLTNELPTYGQMQAYISKAGSLNISSTATVTTGQFGQNGFLYLTVNATSAGVTINLPAASTWVGLTLVVYRSDATANAVLVDANGSELINQGLTFPLSSQNANAKFYSDGTTIRAIN